MKTRLANRGVKPGQIGADSHGASSSIVGDSKNRRVDFIVKEN